ncbi:radial spoke head protein 4 homolog A-like [Symsagittifera roscoffensis]|uniref:radial spoke head protein 4 homolog A-like n=1 Tax=Symsagittifera roscoffensis TaxID=84072 RepID=UPI00307B79DA
MAEQEDIHVSAKEADFQNAKAYMLSTVNQNGINVYDHMCKIITKIISEKPENAVDAFEDISKALKKSLFKPQFDTVQDKPVVPKAYQIAETQKKLFRKAEDDEITPPEGEEEVLTPLTNLMENAFYFEEAGVGLSREEMFRIYLALRQLVDIYPLQKVRFWGKVLGTNADYYVAEVEFREGEDTEEETYIEPNPNLGAKPPMDEATNLENLEDPLPKPDWKAPVVIPHEEKGYGVNKFTYFATSQLGEDWTRLPCVTPAQIDGARRIKKLFTGDLDAPVLSYPPYPGTEKSYLRAQIARITASTNISPINFYMFDEEEEEPEEDAARDHYIENPEFEGVTARDLVDPSNANWVHHVQYLLPQGRCTWFNPAAQRGEEEMDEEEDEEEREEPDEPEPESGPALLTPISEDNEIDGASPWTLKLSSTRIGQYAMAVVKSNLWPGAVTIGFDKKFENVYIGNGIKYSVENYSPVPTPPAMSEYPTGPEVTEADDPTVEEEAALKANEAEGAEGEEAAEEEEEEDDED